MDDVKLALLELKEDSDSGRLQAAPAAARQASPMRLALVVVAVVVLRCRRLVLAQAATQCRAGGTADRLSL